MKRKIKEILISLRTPENEEIVNYILGKIDIMKDEELQKLVEEMGNDEQSIREYLLSKIAERQNTKQDEKNPIENNIITYEISENYIELHLPNDLTPIIKERGVLRTIDTVNLYLLDAIDKIKMLKDSGFYKFQNKDIIQMTSSMIVEREKKFLDSLGFETTEGAASISFETINSKGWKDKKKKIIEELAERGVVLGNNYRDEL